MGYLCICNTDSDTVSVIDTKEFSIKKTINLRTKRGTKVGPHGIIQYKNSIMVVNNYSNNLKIINNLDDKNLEKYFIGLHCNDVAVYDNKAYIVCGELNSVVVFDLISKKIIEEIPCENHPHSIEINIEKKLIVVANFNSDSITLVELNDNQQIYNIRVGAYPTKACFSHFSDHIIICESNIGNDYNGSISIVSLHKLCKDKRIEVNKIPVDLFLDNKLCYVSNFGDGSIDIIDLEKFLINENIYVGGMPRGIAVEKNCLFVGDNYNNSISRIDLNNKKRKDIPIGKEPTGMTFFNLQSKL